MTECIEKSVFISYRRTNFWTALAVFQNLHANGYDVFFDFKSIPSGDFEQVITENVKSRAHFIVILSPSALERCNEPGDWLRREIESAIENKRNIIPLIMEGFNFSDPATINVLTGKLGNLKKYNAMGIPAEYFDEAMTKLRSNMYLNRPLKSVLHPVSEITAIVTRDQNIAANKVAPVQITNLTAEAWFEKGVVFQKTDNHDEAIRCYTEAIRLTPELDEAYNNRGVSLSTKGDLDGVLRDYNEVIRLKPDDAYALNNRGQIFLLQSRFEEAILNFDKAIQLKGDFVQAYNNRAVARSSKGDLDGAIQDYGEAIRLEPDFSEAYYNRAALLNETGDLTGAIQDYSKSIDLNPRIAQAYNNRGNLRQKTGDLDGAINDYIASINIEPENVSAYFNCGLARKDKGDFKRAIKDFTEALSLTPRFNQGYLPSWNGLSSAR